MAKIYTCTGDNGTTSLVGGQRSAKDSPRLEAYGTIDELNSAIGVIISFLNDEKGVTDTLAAIQHNLFNIGACLATDADADPALADKMFPDSADAVRSLESAIDSLDAELPPLNSFILPGGCHSAAFAHLARTICRRAERRIITLSQSATIGADIIPYVNRLSDYLFILARYLNLRNNVSETVWQK